MPRPTWRWLVLLLTCVAGVQATEIRGPAEVIDGDSLRIRDVEIRLSGIDAPEFKQTCQRGRKHWPCGRAARDALRDLVAHTTIRGDWRAKDDYQRLLAVCYDGDRDLNEEMVRLGMALAYRRYSDRYVAAENAARLSERGIWSSEFVVPWLWRQLDRRRNR